LFPLACHPPDFSDATAKSLRFGLMKSASQRVVFLEDLLVFAEAPAQA
jgi:hypothetical protein